ncbi:MAG: FAD-dependent oxidoreductase, partial [Candidatus Lokiarchaeota archaeon]|nr:FAD-dependent oxidoreductase [Candidatus Lokiarchaeota archaeon]MBD3342071.1 FAD-dependent oxidoreductase [Candidatus Lokiarchaeota archaeon]
MNEEYDIIVIGAGFGGPVAAKLCADAQLKTLLIERSEHPGEKVISGLTIPFYGFLFGPKFIQNGNPPYERPSDGIDNYIIKDIDNGDIEVDDSLKVPKPFSPIFAFGYNTYCKEFCEWEAEKAVEAGSVLKTSTTVVDFIKEKGFIKGVLTEKGERIYSKIVIDSEGSQGLLAIKAGLREKYPPEAISLADTYDYIMNKADIDKLFGFSVKMCWGWDEQKVAPPLGYGNGLMVWPYRESLHFMQDQCLMLKDKRVPNLKRNFETYHDNITTKLPWWRDEIAPRIKLRARLWQGFEIYVGLDEKLRNRPIYTNGMILIGDAAGLESTELCDGVPAAWFSAELAAKIAIKAIKCNDYSATFLKQYEDQIRRHPIIQWSITGRNRYNLRFAQEKHDIEQLRKYIHDGWGLGSLTHFTTPFLKVLFKYLYRDYKLIIRVIKMYFRYFQNWILKSYGRSKRKLLSKQKYKKSLRFSEHLFLFSLKLIDFFLKIAVFFGKGFKG